MAQLTVRNLDPGLVRSLKLRAARNDRSAEAEHRAILESSLRSEAADFARRAAELRAATRDRSFTTDSAVLIRQDRDRDHEDSDS